MQTINIYNAIETMHWQVFFTEAPIKAIKQSLEAKFIEIWDSLVATNQIIQVRPANWPEYFNRFILPNLSKSISPKIRSWISEATQNKVVPTIEQIQARIDYFQDEEDKFNLADRQFTPEEKEARLKQVKEMKNKFSI